MRPRELVLRGFRSYTDETTFTFADRSLIGIVGPIGSGKSSILDAVAFALYGKTPRIAADTKSLINQRSDSLHVSLTFEVDGVVWRVQRVLRRKGASAHTLYRLEDGDYAEVADKEKEVTAQVEALLGMDFETFRRSVLLAQNQFAGFLEATGTDRNKVLKGVFGFERLDEMREAAKGRLDRLGGRLQALMERRASAEGDRVLLATRQVELTAADERAAALAALRGSVSQADDLIREAETRAAAAAKEVAALDLLVDRFPPPETTEGVFAEADAAAGALRVAEESAADADSRAAAATGALEAALAGIGGRDALDRAADLVAALRAAVADRDREQIRSAESAGAAAEAQAVHASAAAAVEDAVAAAASARDSLTGAALAEDEARRALHAAHQADQVVVIRAGLAVGEPCPVCTQLVTALPPEIGAPALAAADEGVALAIAGTAAARNADTAAQTTVAERRTAATAAAERVEATRAAVTAAAEAVAKADAVIGEQTAAAVSILGDGDPAERLASMRAALSDAETADRAARQVAGGARAAVDAARTRRDGAAGSLAGLRNDLSNLAGKLGVDIPPGDTAEVVEASLRTLREEWLTRHTAADEARERANHELEAGRIARVELLEGAGLAASDDIVEVSTEAAKEATRIGAEVRLLEGRLAELDALGAEEQALVAASGLLERLHTDLRPSGFLEYVLDERRRSLADLAGVHFEMLSAGRYRFSDDAEFNVVDLNAADLVRSAASLSGGETFLASLALALALAEIVAREGGRLDAFFLDEGFGSLDSEHLELAMDGIERLVAGHSDRVVVVVSHLPEMRDRVEDLIVLDRDDLGVTRVVSGAAAP